MHAARADRPLTEPGPGGQVTRPASALSRLLPVVAVVLALCPAAARADVAVTPPGSIPGALIVGRAACGGATWLLSDARQLVRIDFDRPSVAVRYLSALRKSDRPWGLACIDRTDLWTLVDPRVLARLSADGRVVERVPLAVPWVSLYDWNERLVFAAMPLVVASPVLATSSPRAPGQPQPWPALTVRASARRAELLTQNMVACGLSNGIALPCWFADSSEVVLSDGTFRRAIRISFADRGADRSAPLWDVAMASSDRLWVLFSAGRTVDGRRVGGRVELLTLEGRVLASPSLAAPARLIVAATTKDCWILTTRGAVVRVSAP